MSGLITVIRQGGKRPVKPLYSAVDKGLENLPKKATPEQMMKELLKQPEVKVQEVIERGIDKHVGAPIVETKKMVKLKKPDKNGNTEKLETFYSVTPSPSGTKAITKEDFINKVGEKPSPKIEEITKANPTDKDLDEMAMGLIEKEARERTNDEIGKVGKHNRDEWNDYYDGAVKYLKDYEYDSYLRDAKRYIEEEGGAEFPKFQDWKLPGGENYREILLRLPPSQDPRQIAAKAVEEAQSAYSSNKSSENYSRLVEARKKADEIGADWETSQYRSKHWDEPNVLAHMRVQDRVGPNGEKILHVEEIQSDWHQAGRKQGYKTGREEQDYVDYLKGLELKAKNEAKQDFISEGVPEERAEVLADRMAKRLAEDPRHLADYFGQDVRAKQMELHQARMKARDAIPDAPFKKNWHELATKKLMNYAIENGYDKVAFTPGAEQAKRYKLSNVIDEINVVGRTNALTGEKTRQVALDTVTGKQLRLGVDNNGIVDNVNDPQISNLVGKSLDEIVGKDISNKIMTGGSQTISGEGLQVGGEGMIGFYDKIIPNYLNKEYGPHGVKVGQINIRTGEEPSSNRWAVVMDANNNYRIQDTMSDRFAEPGEFLTKDEAQSAINAKQFGTTLHSIDITPQMREAIEAKGQPLYQAVGVGLTGAAAAPKEEVQFSDNPDTMMMEMEDRGFAGGGLLKRALKGAQAALPAAEREANKAKFLEPSVEKGKFYHSTAKDIKQFIPGGSSRATFVTPNAKFAEDFALDNFAKPGDDQFLQGTNTMPVRVQVKNPFDYENPEHIQDLKDALRHKRWLDEEIEGMGDFEHNWHHVEHPDIQDAIRRLGHDAFYSAERGTKNLGVYDPRKIKSDLGNTGTYDITDPDINKAQGGLTKAKRK